MKLKTMDIVTSAKRQDFMWYIKGRAELAETFYSLVVEKLNQLNLPETEIGLIEEKIKKEKRTLLSIESEGLSAIAKIYAHSIGPDLHVLLLIFPAAAQLSLFQYTDNVAFMITLVEAVKEILNSEPWTR